MERRLIVADIGIVDGVDLTVMLAADDRRSCVEDGDEAEILHAGILDARERRFVLDVVELRLDKTLGALEAIAVSEVWSHLLRHLLHVCSAMNGVRHDLLQLLAELRRVLPDTLAVVLTRPMRTAWTAGRSFPACPISNNPR